MDKLLQKLYNHTNEALIKKENDIIEKNIELFKDLFETILADSKALNKSSIFNKFNIYINDVGIRMLNEGLNNDTIKYINAFYDIYNKRNSEEVVYIFFIDIFHKIYSIIEDLQSRKLISDLRIKRLLYNLIRSSGKKNDFVIDHYAPQMYSAYYTAVFNNKYINNDDKTKLIFEVLDDTIQYGYFAEIRNYKDKIAVLERSMLSLIKSMIDKMDFNRLSNSLKKILKKSYLNRDVINVQKLLMYVYVYLYYLGYKEEEKIVPNKDKKLYVNFLKSEQAEVFYNALKSFSREIWNYYLEVKSELDKWERFANDEAKTLIMKDVVKEFFLFFSIASAEFNLDKINKVSNVVDESDIFSFLDDYLDGNDFNNNLIDSYSVFTETFNFNNRDITYDMNVLKNQLLSAYKSIKLNELKKYLENKEIINANIKNIKEAIRNSIKESPYIKMVKLPVKKVNNRVDKEFEFSIHLSTYFIADKEEADFEYLIKPVKSEFENHILQTFKESGFLYKKLDYSCSNKIDELLETVESIQSEGNININALVSGIPTDSHLLYMESDANKKNLDNYLSKIKYTEVTDKLLWAGFDAENLTAVIHKTIIEEGHICDQEINEILSQCKKGDKYSINLTNNIFAPLTRDEAIEYLRMKKYIIKIKIRYSIVFKELESGFIIQIVFD